MAPAHSAPLRDVTLDDKYALESGRVFLTGTQALVRLLILQRQLSMGLKHEGGGAVPRSAFDMIDDSPAASIADLVGAMEAVQAVHVSEVILKHCVDLVRRTREHRHLDFGCSPRAGLAMVNAARARAVIHGRHYVTPEDLFDLAEDVMLHRMRISYEASAAGHTTKQVLEEILASLG